MDEAGEGAPSPAPHPNCQTQTSKAEVSTWLRTGTFYLALTRLVAAVGAMVGLLMILMKVVPFVPGHFSIYEGLALGIWVVLGAISAQRETP
jgi:hypothetical protein